MNNTNKRLQIEHDPVSSFEAMVKQVYETTGAEWEWASLISVINIKKIKGEQYWNDFFETLCKDNPKESILIPEERWIPDATKKRLGVVETQESFDANLSEIDEKSAEDKMKSLREQISYHNDIYYHHPERVEISDYEFDMMLKDLEQLELKYPQFCDVDSPTKKVGN